MSDTSHAISDLQSKCDTRHLCRVMRKAILGMVIG
jgi:hypothetical protein